jgi:branched-subunit amino acid aminotransferase/4-amino-4-deoxychorismate lyase
VVVSRRPFAPGPLGAHKTTSRLAYHLAGEEARVAGVDEALLVTDAGQVLEGAASSVFAVVGGDLVTPPLGAGILPGITRERVLRLCARLGLPARERALTLAELRSASELFLTNSVQEVVPVAVLDGHELPRREAGARLAEAYRETVAAAGAEGR